MKKEQEKILLDCFGTLTDDTINKLIKDIQEQPEEVKHRMGIIFDSTAKLCFNECPKCGVGMDDIEWDSLDVLELQPFQEATCKKCGTVFREWYTYAGTEIKNEN